MPADRRALRLVGAIGVLAAGGVSGAEAQAQASQPPIVRGASLPASVGSPDNFTGAVTVQTVVTPDRPGRAGVSLVSFRPAARTHWHTHPAGQSLYVTHGCGWTQVAGQAVQRICTGDAAYVAAGVRHWHGATPDGAMRHLAISEVIDGKAVDWAEPVTAAHYHGPAG